jgi:hypothetical protein
MGQGGVELRADWYIDNRRTPELKPTPTPFRPSPSPGMQQIRVQVYDEVFGKFEYLFGAGRTVRAPVFDHENELTVPERDRPTLASLNLVPPEDWAWYRVSHLKPAVPTGSEAYQAALRDSAPESGSFILMSLRRRKLSARRDRRESK